MTPRFRQLQKVKATHEDNALRALQVKRAELADAYRRRAACETNLAKSAESLGAREDAIYQEIMQQIVATDDIDETKENVLKLHKGHQDLEDELELADQQCRAQEAQVEEAQAAYQAAQRTREKFDRMLEDLVAEQAEADERAEEGEIEDLFAKGRPVLA